MAEFNDIRQQLADARNGKAQTQQLLVTAKERLSKINREKELLLRSYDPHNQQQVARLEVLTGMEKTTSATVSSLKEQLSSATALELGARQQFTVFTGPQENIGRLDDAYPFLLLPVRIETRFKKIAKDNTVADQLWIRIFPDDCAVDTFEKLLSETEVKNAAFYWAKLWEAGGVDADERGAWRTLVSSHGSGRAAYIISQYIPVNAGDKPVKADPKDILLVISTTTLPDAAGQTAWSIYWTALLKSAGNKAEETAAYTALVGVVGEANAQTGQKALLPMDFAALSQQYRKDETVQTKVVFLQLPAADTTDTKLQSWSQAPHVNVMPDCFVVIGYNNGNKIFEQTGVPVPSPLIVGPDPNTAPGDQFAQDANGDLVIGEDIRWMVDFEDACNKGLGFKIDLTPIQASEGFDRILTLGVRLSTDQEKGTALLEELIDHHRLSRKGFALLKQGTPTNNTDTTGAGYASLDDADESFDEMKKDKLFDIESDPFLKKDGQWLAESLGISYDALYKVKNSGFTDQLEGKAMNVALWPATMGYMMETLMQPVFSESDIVSTRNFFNNFVSGRGTIPAIKIGKQPYGILPATVFSDLPWLDRRSVPGLTATNGLAVNSNYIFRLYTLLKKIDTDWAPLLDKVSYIGKGGDAHQLLLDAVGLNPASVEYYQRNAESVEELFNRLNLMGFGAIITGILLAAGYMQSGVDLLKQLGYNGQQQPDILNKLFLQSQNLLKGPVIDDRPLSEKEMIRKYTPDPNGINYMQWLINAAQTSHDTLRKQQGFIDNKIPAALLYHVLHHALDLSYVEVSLLLFQQAALLTPTEVTLAKMEPAFLHISQKAAKTESRWQYLYSAEAKVTGNSDLLVGDYIPKIIKTEVATQYLNEQLKSLELLKDIPTARLERAFAEHIDCCGYRLDAWKAGILNYQLSTMRNSRTDNGEQGYRKGIYIGAYGWLEDVRSENKELTAVQFDDPELQDIFIKDQTTPLVKDNTNGGYIMAPSLNHAVTAAVLRNGYMTNDNPDALRINLSSERVRKALSVIEGMRGGQPLSALLGYYLERGLHESHPGVELDYFIYQLRKVFPLAANKNKDTVVDSTTETPIDSVESIEANNVIDGLALIEQIRKTGNSSYPFDKPLPPVDDPAQATAINEEVQKILDINDAIADTALAESVHQVVQGNYDRGAATLDTYSKGNFPPLPDVIQTPRSGVHLTHRVGLHLDTGLNPALGNTPRAKAEPAINKWLTSLLPQVNNIVCTVSYGVITDEEVTAQTLGLEPIDLLYLVNTDNEPAMTDLDDRINRLVLDRPTVRPDTAVTINYMKRLGGKVSFFELAPLMNSLRNILLHSRPLTANDIVLSGNAQQQADQVQFLDMARIQLSYDRLENLRANELTTYSSVIDPLVADTMANRAQILNNIDIYMSDLVNILSAAGQSGLPQTGFGFIYDRKNQLFTTLLKKLQDLIKRWDDKLIDFDDLITAYGALPGTATTDEKFDLLLKARRDITANPEVLLPANPDDFRDSLMGERTPFKNKRDEFNTLFNTTERSLSAFLNAIKAKLPVTAFDLEPFDVEDVAQQIITLATELAAKATGLAADLKTRLTAAAALMTDAAAATEGKPRVDLLLQAAKQLFHDDFKIVPEFAVPTDKADEWANAYSAKDQLLDYLVNTEKKDFPVDEWLYGVARVREKMYHWENTTILAEAFGSAEPALQPLQLPFNNVDSWLALTYPPDYVIDSDRLLYTAHYTVPFDKTKHQCGLLLDEWTEVIPSRQETIGVSFHYDRPNSEPPQVMLLAMPADFKGAWEWQELVNTLHETLDMAKKRAIEPTHIDNTSYARFLPAVVSSMTVYPLTPSLNFAFNNNIQEILSKS
ncbi:hypothetical protein [Chitinophaga sp. MM2321]|uniref:hypothetical protein n=1 Tax=Chitinophaga sp. MM2321 TaxID=3137178 RepID=UPI0032D59D83